MDTQLSPNFKLSELLRSQTAARHDIDMTPSAEVQQNLTRLCQELLQPIRDILGPTHITSGYRPLELNRLLGGSLRSQHIAGLAADLVVTGHTPAKVCQKIAGSMLPFDQCILEFGRWVHVSIAAPGEITRREVLTAVRRDGRTQYLKGLHNG